MRRKLLRWGSSHQVDFPWRTPGNSPYSILVSEVLLRKTGRYSAARIFPLVLQRYRDPSALALAKKRDLEAMLQPLGLHRVRAAALVRIGQCLASEHRGQVPIEPEKLLALPHLGRYGAHAVRCFAFGRPDPIVDTNVARVLGRYLGLPQYRQLHSDKRLWNAARLLMGDTRRSKALNWALLDLAAAVCTSRSPACRKCPLRTDCHFAGVMRSSSVRPHREDGLA